MFFILCLIGNLSENKFKQVLNLEQDELHNKITEWVSAGLALELKNRFYEINTFDNREYFEKIIKAIFHLANQPTKEPNIWDQYIVNFDSENLLQKMMIVISLLNLSETYLIRLKAHIHSRLTY